MSLSTISKTAIQWQSHADPQLKLDVKQTMWANEMDEHDTNWAARS